METVIRAQLHCAQKSSGANSMSTNYGHNKSVLEVTKGTEQCEHKA